MNRRALIQHIERHGCVLLREGHRHTIYVNPMSRAQSSVPRHRELDDFVLNLTKDDHLDEPGKFGFLFDKLRNRAANIEVRLNSTVGKPLVLQTHTEEYYSGLAVELEEKEKRLQAEEAVLERIRDQKKALALDRMKKISDLQAKYRLDVEAKLVNLLILYQPWIRMAWGLRTREGELERVFYWDPVLKDFFNTFCEICRQGCEAFFIRDQKLICRACQEKI